MTTKRNPPGGRNVSIGGNAIGSVIVTGDNNSVVAQQQENQAGPELAELLALIDKLQHALPEAVQEPYRREAIAKELEQAKQIAQDPNAPKDLLHDALESVNKKLKAVIELGGQVAQMIPWAEQAGNLAAKIFG